MLILHATFWNGKWLCLLYFFSLWACTCAAFVQCSNSQGSVLPWFADLREASAALFNPRGLSYGGEAGAFCTSMHYAIALCTFIWTWALRCFNLWGRNDSMHRKDSQPLLWCEVFHTLFYNFSELQKLKKGKDRGFVGSFPLVGRRVHFFWGVGGLVDLTWISARFRWGCTRF